MYSARCDWKGLTLIEVVASIALISALLIGILVSFNKHTRQLHHAKRLMLAIEMTDNLIAQRYHNAKPWVDGEQGTFMDQDMFWEVSEFSLNVENADWAAKVARLSVFDRSLNLSKPILSVELAAHDEDAMGTRPKDSQP